ncbi:MAG: proline dehydrogenase family protein [Saprospiraceae bacterium]|nr:proline dehydrogenase family protein [Saprospiraceae bacterium]
MEETDGRHLDFGNTEIAFSHKSDRELKKTYRLFKLMNNPKLVSIGSFLGNIAAKVPFHLLDPIIRETVFYQFCGGTNLLECQKVVDRLYHKKALTILDYGVEARNHDEDFQNTLEVNLKALEFAFSNPNIPVISTKLTGYIPFSVLEKMHAGETLTTFDKIAWERLEERFVILCNKAAELGVGIFIDAEESWIQNPIDHLVDKYMPVYNKEKPILYNTYQMYRTGRLEYLKNSFDKARSENYILGAKIVRGAYMEKERNRAKEKGYPDPIQIDKLSTDNQYDDSIRFCVQFPELISLCNSSHNWSSCLLQVELMKKHNIPNDHPNLNFCQLLGMSDNITFNLASQGYYVAKYVPYGPIRDVVPYLVRRAQENSSITGDMSRELKLLDTEMKRRGLK